MSVTPDAVIQSCYEKATKNRALENRFSSVFLSVCQNHRIDKICDSRQSLDKIDKIRMFSKKSFASSHDVHRAMVVVEECSKPTKCGEYQYVSGVIGMSYNPILCTEAGAAYLNFEVMELLKLWTEKIIEIDTLVMGDLA